ncbi:MAG: cupin-like domain-containing protein [Woeseiaceae bacterium]|nr:cupin-like domain-containing protein [Woeseiaceae bacterium]
MTAPIREWQDVNAARFEELKAAGEPAVIRGFASDWPIVRTSGESTDALMQYIGSFGEDTRVKAFHGDKSIKGRYFYSDDLLGFNFERRELTLGQLLEALKRKASEADPDGLYAGAIPLRDSLAGINAENPNPLLGDDIEQLISMWIGNRGRTAPHWDLPQNIAVVVSGKRTFTLFPPEQLPNMYVGSVDFTLAGQPISLVDLHEPDFERFPKFKDALAAATAATLEPGDAIYVPSMWFHHVEAHDAFSILINYWWRDAEAYMFSPLFTLMHALLSIRDLPEREREIWRKHFDHYIFQTDGEPMEHIPERARGVFQEMHPELVTGLRAYLLKSLGGVPKR